MGVKIPIPSLRACSSLWGTHHHTFGWFLRLGQALLLRKSCGTSKRCLALLFLLPETFAPAISFRMLLGVQELPSLIEGSVGKSKRESGWGDSNEP